MEYSQHELKISLHHTNSTKSVNVLVQKDKQHRKVDMCEILRANKKKEAQWTKRTR